MEFIELAIDDVRKVIGPQRLLHVRIDSAGDCTEIMAAIHAKGALFVTKADMTADLCATIHAHRRWSTVDEDANGEPTRQVAVIPFRRKQWGTDKDLPVKVIAVRSRDRDSGKQLYLWDGLDYTVQVYLTNDQYSDPDDVARRYEGRAGIEPLIAEWKNAWGIGKMSTASFQANSALLLLKLLAHNLLRRYVLEKTPQLGKWRTAWIRRSMILVPGRMTRSGRRRTIRMPIRPALQQRMDC